MQTILLGGLLGVIFATETSAQTAPASSYILTPKAPDTPRINCAKIYGARPINVQNMTYFIKQIKDMINDITAKMILAHIILFCCVP